MYDLYKPLRNRLRQHDLQGVLSTCHYLMQWMAFDAPLPPQFRHARMNRNEPGRGIGLVEWEVDLLIREAILNCSYEMNGRPVDSWNALSEIINSIKRIENDVWSLNPEDDPHDVLWELYRLSHRQFPWQEGMTHAVLLRYFKIFAADGVSDIFVETHGVTPSQFFQIGIALAGHFMRRLNLQIPVRLDFEGLTQDHLDTALAFLSQSLEEAKVEISENQLTTLTGPTFRTL